MFYVQKFNNIYTIERPDFYPKEKKNKEVWYKGFENKRYMGFISMTTPKPSDYIALVHLSWFHNTFTRFKQFGFLEFLFKFFHLSHFSPTDVKHEKSLSTDQPQQNLFLESTKFGCISKIPFLYLPTLFSFISAYTV